MKIISLKWPECPYQNLVCRNNCCYLMKQYLCICKDQFVRPNSIAHDIKIQICRHHYVGESLSNFLKPGNVFIYLKYYLRKSFWVQSPLYSFVIVKLQNIIITDKSGTKTYLVVLWSHKLGNVRDLISGQLDKKSYVLGTGSF